MVPDRARDEQRVDERHEVEQHRADRLGGGRPDSDQFGSDQFDSDQVDDRRDDGQHRPTWHCEASANRPSATWSDWSCTVRVVVSDPRVLDGAVAMVMARMRQVERSASRFVVDSDLNWANANSGRPVAVSALLVELVQTALDGARRSDGALDPTVGRHLAAIGYDRDILLVTDGPAAADVPPGPSGRTWRDVVVDRELGLLTVPRGTALDLGATAKAQTADWSARAVHQRYGAAVLVEIGGDLAVCGGDEWRVTVAERAGGPGQRIAVRRGGVATSTTTIRSWLRGDQRMHHIVDPRTSRPSDGPWRTITVAAESAVEANVCSTAAIVLGDRARDWLRSQPVSARLVGRDGHVSVIGGWPAETPGDIATPGDTAAAGDTETAGYTATPADTVAEFGPAPFPVPPTQSLRRLSRSGGPR